MDLYELARGCLVWVAATVFIVGIAYRIAGLVKTRENPTPVSPGRRTGNGVRAVLHGIIPFASGYMRAQPGFAVIAFAFHACVLLLPAFLLAHIVLWYESWGLLWWSLPDRMADAMALLVVTACLYFLTRRLLVTESRRVTRPGDILLPLLVMAPFLTGFLASHHVGPYRWMLISHILSAEALIAAIPFTKLVHMVFFFFTRMHMGAEFGGLMRTKDW